MEARDPQPVSPPRAGYFSGGFSLDRMSWIKPEFPVDDDVPLRLG
jgi:hypothetical protein